MIKINGIGGIFFKAKALQRLKPGILDSEGNKIELWEPIGEEGQN